MADVIEINDLDQLQPYRISVEFELLPQTPRASFFPHLRLARHDTGNTSEAERTLSDSRGNRSCLGEIIGIVPFCIQTGSNTKLAPFAC